MRSPLLLSPFLLALGCGGPSPQPGTPPAAAQEADTASTVALPWSREGLEAQPRMAWLRQRTPPELGYSPATTAWRPVDWEVPAALARPGDDGAATPEALLLRLVTAIEWGGALGREVWEQTTRVWYDGDDAAVGVVLHWGLQDDSMAGHDLRVRVRRAAGSWYVERVEERFHCSRAATPDGLCV
jgi:hypothetical protein